MPASEAIVSCIPGWDGGLQQSFTLEVRESKNKHSRILASVQHSPLPFFNLKGLKPREHYLFIVTAVNTRGTSPPVTVSYITPFREMPSLASHTGDSAAWISWTSFVAVIFGAMLSVLSCLCAVLGLMKFKSAQRVPPKPRYQTHGRPGKPGPNAPTPKCSNVDLTTPNTICTACEFMPYSPPGVLNRG